MYTKQELESVCHQFQFEGIFIEVIPYGAGHINDTFKVTYEKSDNTKIHYILQRVNHTVFRETEQLMDNILKVTDFLSNKMIHSKLKRDKEVLALIYTKNGQHYYLDESVFYWRAYVFVEQATGYLFAENKKMLYEAGQAFGQFLGMLKDFPVNALYEVIPDFHHTKNRFNHFLTVVQDDPKGRLRCCESEVAFVVERQEFMSKIVEALEHGLLPYRVTHNDTKLNNVLLDDETGEWRCVIDLDTVMPGSILYDYGDAIRSCASKAKEDESDLSLVHLDMERFKSYTFGFLDAAGELLTELEKSWLPIGAIMMTLECGMRFLTDYLEGDHYFKTHIVDHNLIRAKNQFQYVVEMEKQIEAMQEIINRHQNKSVLVTGGMGYIGSHTVVALLETGHDVIIYDNLSNSKKEVLEAIEAITGKRPRFIQGDIQDEKMLTQVFENHSISAVIHFAGLKAVGESVEKPLTYYKENVFGSMVLLDVMLKHNCKQIVFSSSATVYGMENSVPFKEDYPRSAINPYGKTKWMIELMLEDLPSVYPEMSIVMLRYFNPIGAHKSGLIGENPNNTPNNLLPYVAQVAMGTCPELGVFGNDYDTLDGTGVRDYIHVVDLAKGHLKALEYMKNHQKLEIFNLGCGKGYSVLEVVQMFEKVSGKNIPYRIGPRRKGDIGLCYAAVEKSQKYLGFSAVYGLEDMCRDAWRFVSSHYNQSTS